MILTGIAASLITLFHFLNKNLISSKEKFKEVVRFDANYFIDQIDPNEYFNYMDNNNGGNGGNG